MKMNTDNGALCALTDVEKSWSGVRVLGPVSVEVRPGEILGLLGPNGAGKSTLMSIMAGQLRPDAGTCVRSEAARRSTGWVPQELSLYEAMTGNENLKFWGLASGLPKRAIEARSRWLLEKLDLSGRGRDKVLTYSGGMKRRLHLASALMTTPALLLLDEPTVGADGDSAELILDMLRHLRGMGTGIVLISHRAGEAQAVSDRVITLKGGLIAGEARV